MTQALRYPRPAELARLGRGHGVVESSAGTGKTFLLEHLFVDLILTHGLACEEILVVTFTEKATAELVIRLRALIARLAGLRPGDAKAIEAASAPASASWVIDDKAKRILSEALLAFDRASIFTIHGFCQRVLRDHAFVQGRFFDEELIGEEAAFADAFHEVLRTQAAGDQAEPIAAWLESGKSVDQMGTLLRACEREKTAPLRVRFDEARLAAAQAAWQPVAAGDQQLKQRLKDAKVHHSTIKSTIHRLARASEIVAACQGDSVRFLAAMQSFPGEPGMERGLGYVVEKLPATDASLADLARTVRELHEATVPLEAYLAERLSPLIRERAARRKRRAGLFDFSDMLALVAGALADPGSAGSALVEALRRRYRHALIDEFQDTDDVQWSIFQRLFVEAGAGRALTVIGDPKQAIYGFRGADVHAYLGARQALHSAGGSLLVLGHNFRSTAAMIEATNLIFDQGAEFFRRESGITYDQPVRCGRADLRLVDESSPEPVIGIKRPQADHPSPGGRGVTRFEDLGPPITNGHLDTRLTRLMPMPEPVVVFGVATQESVLRKPRAHAAVQAAIVDELHILLDPASSLRLRSHDGDRKLKARDVFILTFTNAESQAIGRALSAASIPYAFYKLGNLFESTEAAEVLAVLRAIAAPEDRNLRAQALLTGFFDLDVTGAAACLDQGPAAPQAQLLLRFAALAHQGDIPALFASMIDDSGIVRREVFAQAGERTQTNIAHVLEILQAEWARTHAPLPELADLLDAFMRGTQAPPSQEGDLQRLETDKDAVQILTVHKAKGLEADVVFLYGGTGERATQKPTHVVHDGGKRMLHVGRLDEAGKRLVEMETQDERSRLLYVALTRARYRLYLPHYPPEFGRLKGPYLRANQRLDSILGERNERSHPRFSVRPCPADAPHGRRAVPAPPHREVASLPAPTAREPDDLAAIKAQRSGFVVTSYTAVKHAHGPSTTGARTRSERPTADITVDVAVDVDVAVTVDVAVAVAVADEDRSGNGDEDDYDHGHDHDHGHGHDLLRLSSDFGLDGGEVLPGGAETGIFLHDILATVVLADLVSTPSFADWFARPAVASLLERMCRRHARPAEHLPLAARLVHRAYTTPVRLGDAVIAGLASAKIALREVEFLFPIPEHAHPLLSRRQTGAPSWKVERGVVKGFVDLLFEHDGRVFVCDWKSDDLLQFDPDTLARHCGENYDVQARIYTIATLRLCGVTTADDYARRFGGVVYCFLRGLRDHQESGLHFFKPTWEDVLAWENDMLGQQFWGIAR